MNILFICDEYPPAKSGGIGSVTKIVAETFAARGHTVVVFSGRLPKHGLPFKSVNNGVTIYRHTYFKSFGNLIHYKNFVSFLKQSRLIVPFVKKELSKRDKIIERIIEKYKIDLVEIPDYTLLTPYYSRIAFIPFKKFSVTTLARVHGSVSFLSYYRDGIINPISRQNDVSLFSNVDGISAVSRFSAQFLNNKLSITKKINVIYNPLENSFLEAAKRIKTNNGDSSENAYIFFVGKVIETKGAFTLIKAFNHFSASHPEYRLIMAGGGDFNTAEELIDSSVRDKVKFTGYIDRNELIRYISNSKFCVIPSYYENFSMAALEVMALKKALIYTKETSGPEVIDNGEDGLLVNPRVPQDVLEAMNFLADNPALIREMGEKAYKTITSKFTTQIVINQLEQFYKKYVKT